MYDLLENLTSHCAKHNKAQIRTSPIPAVFLINHKIGLKDSIVLQTIILIALANETQV